MGHLEAAWLSCKAPLSAGFCSSKSRMRPFAGLSYSPRHAAFVPFPTKSPLLTSAGNLSNNGKGSGVVWGSISSAVKGGGSLTLRLS